MFRGDFEVSTKGVDDVSFSPNPFVNTPEAFMSFGNGTPF
jgi:hypothetical protein